MTEGELEDQIADSVVRVVSLLNVGCPVVELKHYLGRALAACVELENRGRGMQPPKPTSSSLSPHERIHKAIRMLESGEGNYEIMQALKGQE